MDEVSLTDEEWAKFEEMWRRFEKGPDDPKIVTIQFKGQEIAEWMRDKFRAVYDLIVFTGETYYGKDFGGKGSIKDVDREIFAAALMRPALDHYIKRMNASANAFLKGVLTEIHESWPAFLETAFKDDRAAKSKLPTKSQMAEIWQKIIQDHLDPKFVRDGRGGDRKSGTGLTEAERAAIAERKATLAPFWDYLISQFEKLDYEDDVWEWIRNRKQFKEQCKKHGITSLQVLSSLIPDVLKRRPYWEKTATGRTPEPLMPAAFALIHAARETGLSEEYWGLKKAVGKIKK